MNSGNLCLRGVIPPADTPQHSFNNITVWEPHALSNVMLYCIAWHCSPVDHGLWNVDCIALRLIA
eukprot:1629801-Alexandrium_andersonii.AAC.1